MTADHEHDNTPSDPPTSTSAKRWLQSPLRKWREEITSLLIALFSSFLIGGMLILLSGDNPLLAYAAIVKGAFGDSFGIASTITRGLPIIGAGIATGWAFKAGLINLGVEGQLLLGGMAAYIVAVSVPLSPILLLSLTILASMVAGGLWSMLSGWLETQFDVPILVSSLLMNFLAIGLVSYMINFHFLEVGGSRSQTPMIADIQRLPRLVPGTSLSAGLYLIIGLVIAAMFMLRRTAHGFELTMFGANREFAVSTGVNPVRMTLVTMFSSGMIAGMVGFILVFGVHYRMIDGALTGPGYAWTGMMAAIIANNNPVGIVVGGLFFSAVQTGSSAMERTHGIPFEISFVVQAIIILLVASRKGFSGLKRKDTT